MKELRLLIIASFLFPCVFLIAGCATTYQYEGNHFPPLSSSSFPSFDSVREITDGIRFKLADGSGKTKATMDFTFSKGQRNIGMISSFDLQWDRNFKDNLIYSNYLMEMITNIGNMKNIINMKFDSVYETSGKEIKINVSRFSIDGKERINEMTIEQLNTIKEGYSDLLNDDFAKLGKTFKTGDVFRYTKGKWSDTVGIPDINMKYKIPEVIKGVGTYKNKMVVVTETIMEDSVHSPESIFEMRGKSYTLYDAETLIQLFGEGVIYTNYFTPKKGTVSIRMDARIDTSDVTVRNVIDLPISADVHATKESSKPSWSEASDKIKALGELFGKGLISKEEYETKKNALLKNF